MATDKTQPALERFSSHISVRWVRSSAYMARYAAAYSGSMVAASDGMFAVSKCGSTISAYSCHASDAVKPPKIKARAQ